MLESLTIRNLGLIRSAELELCNGLVVITGETGAGKTLLLDAISALAGGKPGFVGTAADTTVDGLLRLTDTARAAATEIGADIEDGVVTISRSFPKAGRARTALGGRPVPTSALAELAGNWLAVHGQHDTLRLLRASTHRELLDRHGGSSQLSLLEQLATEFHSMRQAQRELAKAIADRAQIAAAADSLKADLAVCESLALQPNEDLEIAATIERISGVEQLRQAVAFAVEALDEDQSSANSLIGQAAHQLEHAVANDSDLAELATRLRAVQQEISDISRQAGRLLDAVEVDPATLDALMLRQRQIKTMVVRHGPTLADVLEWQQQARAQLALLDPDNDLVAELEARVASSNARCARLADKLHSERTRLAEQLAAEVSAELRALAMPFAVFDVRIEVAELSESGTDRVEFVFSANPGLALQPIQQSASGGELARLMLALEVVLAGDDAESTPSVMVFDEVDAGVAGAAATSVAERLARLARGRQVLVVSHLAQIAAFADQQVVVSKDSDGMVTETQIRSLQPADQVVEIARMLAGLEGSESAREHAMELLEYAQALKRSANA